MKVTVEYDASLVGPRRIEASSRRAGARQFFAGMWRLGRKPNLMLPDVEAGQARGYQATIRTGHARSCWSSAPPRCEVKCLCLWWPMGGKGGAFVLGTRGGNSARCFRSRTWNHVYGCSSEGSSAVDLIQSSRFGSVSIRDPFLSHSNQCPCER